MHSGWYIHYTYARNTHPAVYVHVDGVQQLKQRDIVAVSLLTHALGDSVLNHSTGVPHNLRCLVVHSINCIPQWSVRKPILCIHLQTY